MSTVTDVILTVSGLDDDDQREDETLAVLLPELDKVHNETGYRIYAPSRVSRHATGGAAMQAGVFVGAYNHFPEEEFIAAIERVPWTAPEAVRLFIQREHDECGFHEVRLRLPGERRRTRKDT